MSDAITIARPEGMSDGRWEALAQRASIMVNGHMPWCSDHREADDPDGGWCFWENEIRGVCIVDVSNGTLEGTTRIGIEARGDVTLDSLSIREAGVIASQLEHAIRVAKLWNTGVEK